MMKEEVVVEVLLHILDHLSSNILGDCCEIIEKLFESVQFTEPASVDKTLCSVKLLLNLFEKIHLSDAETETALPAEKVIRGLRHLVGKTDFGTSAQSDLLSIISTLCRIRATCKVPNLSELLTEFHDGVLSEISETTKNEEYDSEQVTFLLKILYTLFRERNATAACPEEATGEVEECLRLALRGNDNIATLVSLFLVPEFIKHFKTRAPVEYIWNEFSKSDSRNDARIFLILCNFLSVDSLIGETNLVEFLVGQVKYWELVQQGLLGTNVTVRKQAMYVFQKTIDVLGKKARIGRDRESHSTECTAGGNSNCHWDPNCKDELIKIYSDMIVILEYLSEEQVHIIRPIFEKIEETVEKIIQRDLINSSWILLIYELVLKHESLEVNKWGVKSLLKAPIKVFLDEGVVRKTAILLILNLQDIDLYYNEGLVITEALAGFFERVAQLPTAASFFKTFIKQMCQLVWSPEALFFVTRSFCELRERSFWDEDDIVDVGIFVSKAFRTHNKIIRNGIQCEILNAVLALTGRGAVPLETMMSLFSKFSTTEIFRPGSRTWNSLIGYLKNYSKEDAKKILTSFLSSSQHNEECAARSITLFDHAFEDRFATETFLDLLSFFTDSQRRPYCDVSTLNRHLSIVSRVIDDYIQLGEHPKLLKLVLPFLEDLILYIHSQIGEVSRLEDFSTCDSCLKAFESLMKLINLCGPVENTECLFTRLLKSLEWDLCSEQEFSPVQKYFRMRLLKTIYESCPYKLEPVCVDSHILHRVNALLRREENARDPQSIWGKMNSQFFEANWTILDIFIRNGTIRPAEATTGEINSILDKDLLETCLEGLDVGRYGPVSPIMNILGRILPQVEDPDELERIFNMIWTIVLERRKTDEFKFYVERFAAVLFQEKLFSRESALRLVIKYVDLMFSHSNVIMIHALMSHAEKIKISKNSMPVLCRILGKGLLFGPVPRKDERLTAQVCSYVQSFWNFPESENLTSAKIRAQAAAKLVSIRHEKGVSGKVLDILLQAENETSKHRTRYFGNSYIHRVKTRVMQGVLLLLDSCEKEEREKIAEWVYSSLMTENPQTSVRNLQEWSLSLLNKFCYSSFNYFEDGIKKTSKGWCSVMTMAYLLAKASLCGIDAAMQQILSFCMDQHFEVRLYAQVIIVKLYCLAQEMGLSKVVEKWRVVHDCIKKSVTRAEGNAAKNYAKLEKHFFFNGFNMHSHYSLQTIYYDLPRLTNVAADEWIPSEHLDGVSVSGDFDLGLKVINQDRALQTLSNTGWVTERAQEYPTSDEPTGRVLENYQKKMIPIKQLIPGRGGAVESLDEDGLIVVASLIDRIPNLGGLARTCEVFGASQLVLNTTKCMEDKDFKSLSVTAEKWIRVTEVKTECLMEYIVEMREKGFRIIGAEQTMQSEPLTGTKFPRKCLLVLGNEKKGIPANLIPLLDICVEIPQMGIIRSLNVHVTGALFLWEYAKQNLFSLAETNKYET